MRTIARREALRIITSTAARVDAGDDCEAIGEVDEPLDAIAERIDAGRLVMRLSREDQTILFLRHWADKSAGEISTMLGLPLGTVKVRLHRAHKKLADRPWNTPRS
jgi:RNA polymerase sigma-70 factor (ECF subfamily)